jgi:uncharacterized protein
LGSRRDSILRSLEERELLTDELKDRINKAETIAILEDLYLPFRPKRRTTATIAREKGLEPLRVSAFLHRMPKTPSTATPLKKRLHSSIPERSQFSRRSACRGKRYHGRVDKRKRRHQNRHKGSIPPEGRIKTNVVPDKTETGVKYRDYYDWEEPVATAPSHRILAMRREKTRGYWHFMLSRPMKEAIAILDGYFIKGNNPVRCR